MRRAWVLTVFGDILGFKKWHRNVATAPEIKRPFMKHYFREIERLVLLHPGQFKRLGDGFMLILNIKMNNGKKQQKILSFLSDLRDFVSRIKKIIRECEWPPDGFRIRTTAGYADEYLVTDMEQPRRRKQSEYISDLINLCEQLLHIRPEVPMICHITTLIALSEKRRQSLHLKRVSISARDIFKTAKFIDPADIKDLFEVPLKEKI